MFGKGRFIRFMILLLATLMLASGCYSYRKYQRYPKPRKNCHGCPSFTHDRLKPGTWFA